MRLNSPDNFFTVYQTKTEIELRAGCNDFGGTRVICTTTSYENAKGLAQLAAKMNHLPLVDHVSLLTHQN
ncbi:MAG TPA: hypothetical protein IGS53_22120 [Leptolyngbyaceae cyanobacterium M33_DOE_097]|uniref:Uncharacterized protein n=1 Tax=Oscillatoriales cyanobacterium SpSt-418 TaxID=2282169 RepID=A0A7C3PL00_9CYAN|nr:hypothetical protein [Leptolyngbyaceae cyanobacterium M33_DOE_097]